MDSLRVKKLVDTATTPKRGTPLSAGYDLYSIDTHVIMPWTRGVIPTGISLGLPVGTYGRIAPRSGLAVKSGIDVGAGVIDRDYTGEVKVVLFNLSDDPYIIRPGYRIAQLILEKNTTAEISIVDEIEDTDRGNGGFGSTGTS